MAERASLAVSNPVGVAGPITAEDTRLGIAAGYVPNGLVTARSGFRPSHLEPGKVTASGTADKWVHVAPFHRVHQSVRSGGVYTMTLDTTKDINVLDTQPAHSSGTTKHLIIAHQNDVQFGEADSLMRVRLVLGASGANTDPSLAAFPEYVPLARLNIAPNATTVTNAMIEDLRPTDRFTVAVGGTLPVKDQAERDAISNPYEGMPIYRIDKDWQEFWDGNGWRVRGYVVVNALADITHPYTGQLVELSTDQIEYRWSGAAWQAVRLATVHPVIERRLNASTPIGAGADTKIPFDTQILAGVDITYDAANKWFSFARPGEYQASLSIRVDTLAQLYLWWGKTGTTTGNRGKTSTRDVLNLATSPTFRVAAANETWAAYMWTSPANNLVRETPGDAESYAPWIKIRYVGPL